MGKKEQDLREMLHKYRKQAQELLDVIAESKRKDAERLDAQKKAEGIARVKQKKAEGIARVNHRAFYDGTSVPSSRQGKSKARSHVRFGMTSPGDVAQTNIPQLIVKRVSFPKD